MNLNIFSVAEILGASSSRALVNHYVSSVYIDSRSILKGENALFIAIKGNLTDGHYFINDAYNRGVRNFIVTSNEMELSYVDANFLVVSDTILALQDLAAFHRAAIERPIIGITGSNGKTIVKEWIYHLLRHKFIIHRSPRSYNSQIGVPLSVLGMDEHHNLGIIEAGISKPGEMQQLRKIIAPTFGIITNLGTAHEQGFTSKLQKLYEKISLFQSAAHILINKELLLAYETEFGPLTINTITWSITHAADYQIVDIEYLPHNICFALLHHNSKLAINIPFTTPLDLENAIEAVITAHFYGLAEDLIRTEAARLPKVAMRMEILKGKNNCTIINDVYSSDLLSLDIAIAQLGKQAQHPKRYLINTDIEEHNLNFEEIIGTIIERCTTYGIQYYYGIGPKHFANLLNRAFPPINTKFFEHKGDLLQYLEQYPIANASILIKGARKFELEDVVKVLVEKTHATLLEINLQSIVHNLQYFKSLLAANTMIMAMVKATSYGSGAYEIAQLLAEQNVDYLGVAYTDEGVILRQNGIKLPIMVMNVEKDAFQNLLTYNLEPEIYALDLLYAFIEFLSDKEIVDYPIHLKLDTGMHRLGLEANEIAQLGIILTDQSLVKVKSILSHLSASEDHSPSSYVHYQAELFDSMANILIEQLGYKPMRHLLNSSGIRLHPSYHYEMVRIGIGLYGLTSTADEKPFLEPVHTLKTYIAQLKSVKSGDRIGYTRTSNVSGELRVATINIGYADGIHRSAGNGHFEVLINGVACPTIGNICMDMCMVDVTHVKNIHIGDEVILFSPTWHIEQLATSCHTIAYEILTSLSQRLKRIYIKD